MRSDFLDGGAASRSARVTGNQSATAAGAGDATEVNGAWINRLIEDKGMVQSAKLVIEFTAALGQDETLTFAGNFQDASDSAGTGVADYEDAFSATTAATGNSGGSTESGTLEFDINLAGAKQYVRAQITPNLSASGTDTVNWSATLILYGGSRVPLTKASAKLGYDI
ncbi:hypothetical protein [Roseibium sp. Sym1]|uniref:hypothetical protein n=1 Tax=Roseibium sp. Sym1 TaxID=3016006 RepID=UPI0022B3EE1E|nr:hypothetical protein [Roseibium sp. Sym1]